MSDKEKNRGAMRVDTDAIRKLADLLNETNLNEIEVEDGDRKIKIVRHMDFGQAFANAQAGSNARIGFVSEPGQAQPPVQAAEPAPAAEIPPASHPGAVKSPMVGTVFLSPEPGAAPFIAVGAKVSEGDTLLIIEAMKVMNPIEAPVAGKIAEILIENGQPVEYGQLLVVIE